MQARFAVAHHACRSITAARHPAAPSPRRLACQPSVSVSCCQTAPPAVIIAVRGIVGVLPRSYDEWQGGALLALTGELCPHAALLGKQPPGFYVAMPDVMRTEWALMAGSQLAAQPAGSDA